MEVYKNNSSDELSDVKAFEIINIVKVKESFPFDKKKDSRIYYVYGNNSSYTASESFLKENAVKVGGYIVEYPDGYISYISNLNFKRIYSLKKDLELKGDIDDLLAKLNRNTNDLLGLRTKLEEYNILKESIMMPPELIKKVSLEINILEIQINHMRDYLKCLTERLRNFTNTNQDIKF